MSPRWSKEGSLLLLLQQQEKGEQQQLSITVCEYLYIYALHSKRGNDYFGLDLIHLYFYIFVFWEQELVSDSNSSYIFSFKNLLKLLKIANNLIQTIL
jgi:hypothetical protein